MTTIQSAYQPLAAPCAPPHADALKEAPPTAHPASAVSPWLYVRWVCLITLFLMLCIPALAVVGVASYFYLSSPTKALRDAVMDSAPGHWHKQIAINVGSMTLDLARFGVSFSHLPPDAKEALRCLNNGDVGIYEFEDAKLSPDYALILKTADKSMKRRGFERIVGVVDGRDFVAVYAPKDQPAKDIDCSVVVLSDKNLVVVSACGDTGPMLEFAQKQLHTKELGNLHHLWR